MNLYEQFGYRKPGTKPAMPNTRFVVYPYFLRTSDDDWTIGTHVFVIKDTETGYFYRKGFIHQKTAEKYRLTLEQEPARIEIPEIGIFDPAAITINSEDQK